jgi:hypothetical protein
MNIKQYFSPNFLFTYNTANVSPQEKLIFIFAIVAVLLAVVLKISAILAPNPVDSKYRSKFYKLFLTAGLSGLAWYFCRYENVKFFGTHFVSGLIILAAIIWFVGLLTGIIRRYKTDKQTWDKEQVRLKYLPKNNQRLTIDN